MGPTHPISNEMIQLEAVLGLLNLQICQERNTAHNTNAWCFDGKLFPFGNKVEFFCVSFGILLKFAIFREIHYIWFITKKGPNSL